MTPLRNQYKLIPRVAGGTVSDLMNVLPVVRQYYPTAHMQGSVGLARSFFDGQPQLLVAYTWGVRRRDPAQTIEWKFFVFKEPQHW